MWIPSGSMLLAKWLQDLLVCHALSGRENGSCAGLQEWTCWKAKIANGGPPEGHWLYMIFHENVTCLLLLSWLLLSSSLSSSSSWSSSSSIINQSPAITINSIIITTSFIISDSCSLKLTIIIITTKWKHQQSILTCVHHTYASYSFTIYSPTLIDKTLKKHIIYIYIHTHIIHICIYAYVYT